MTVPGIIDDSRGGALSEKRNIFYWTLYDFANTSYSIIVVTFLYAVYFKDVVAQGASVGDFYWSLGISISMIITALIAPMLGAVADYSAGKKRFLLFFTLLCVLSTSLFYFIGAGDLFWGILLFIFANIGFEAGLIFYDSFLPEITAPKNYGRVSGYGFAMGYLGSFLSLAIAYPFIVQKNVLPAFPLSALFFALFSLPLFLFVKEKRSRKDDDAENEQILPDDDPVTAGSFFRIGFSRVKNTLTNLPKYKNLTVFLTAYFFYIEGVNTVIFFAGNFASSTLGFDLTELILFFITVQITALIGSVVFGIVSDTIGEKKTLLITLVIWLVTVAVAFFVNDKLWFYVVGLLAGAAMGASQSTSRSLMSKLTPYERKTEFFGFFSLFGKSSAVIGPLLFGLVSWATGNQRIAILSLTFFFVVGIILLLRVTEPDENSLMHETASISSSDKV